MAIKWNDHSKLEGLHAFLGASQWHWINWNDEIFEKRFASQYSTTLGTAIHELASQCIKSRTKLTMEDKHLIDITLYKAKVPKSTYDAEKILANLIPFVNDAIGYHMSSEIILYYSPFCFGTTDAIGYDERTKTLRVHDYKSGSVQAHIEQLMIYAALFCLEYHINPKTLKRTELRIYQDINNQGPTVLEYFPEAQEIEKFMDIIKRGNELAMALYERDGK